MGFTPIEHLSQGNETRSGFTPLTVNKSAQESAIATALETIKDIGRVYPVAETAGNLATQAVALPVAGIAGLGALATNAIGLTETDPADVVHRVAGALTYDPQTESGKHLTNAATYPFQKLAEAGRYVGDKTLEATGSPVLATAADTAVNALPMAIPVGRTATHTMPEKTVKLPDDAIERTEIGRESVQASVARDAGSGKALGEPTVRVLGKNVREIDDLMLKKMSEVSLFSTKARQVLHNEIARRSTSTDAPVTQKGFVPLEQVSIQAKVEPVSTQQAMFKPDEGISEATTMTQATEVPPLNHGMPDGVSAKMMDVPKVKTPLDVFEETLAAGKANAQAIKDQAEMRGVTPEAVAPLTMVEHQAAMSTEAPKPKATEEVSASMVSTETTPLTSSITPPESSMPEAPKVEEIPLISDLHSRDSVVPDAIPPTGEAALSGKADSLVTNHAVTADVTARRTAGFTPLESAMPDTPVEARAAWAPGANYTGFVDNAASVGKLSEKPIRREDVLIPLMKDLDLRLYEGRVKGERLGFYIPKVGAVRIKNKSDLEVAAHEIAHALDDRMPEIRASWLKGDMAKVHVEELRGVSYDKTKLYEGFAEFTRLYMTQPEKAKAAAPNYYKWFDDFTKQHKSGAAIRKAQERMTAWFSQDALARAQSKVGKQRVINEALDGVGDKFRQAVTDDLHGVYRMERQLTGKTSPLGAYETARLTRGAGGLVDGAIRLGAPIRKANGSFDFQGKGLEKILEPVAGNLNEFLMYAVGRSSQELMMQGREKLFTPAEVQSMVQLKRPEFDTAFAEYQTWNNGVLDFAESMGVINKKARSMWKRSQYLPYYRVGQAGATASKGGAQGNWAGIQALTGGTGNLRDILGNMTQNAATLIDTALKNEARTKIVKLAETEKGGGNFLVKIEPDSKQVKIDREQVKDKLLEAAGIDPKAARSGMLDTEQAKMVATIEQQMDQAPGLFEFMVHNQTPKGNIMAVLEDGKPTYYEVADPLLFRAVSSLNRAPQHWIIRMLGMPKRIGQMTITLTPDFMVANIARDTIMGAVMSRAGFRPFVDSAKGMASRIKQDPAYREYLANGGGFASYLKDENTFRAHLDRFYSSKGINPKTVLDTPDKAMYFVETLADAFEMSTRLGEYKRLREQGVHPREAAYLGREISTDFAMKGDSQVLGAMYDTVMFLRPAVVSMDRLYRGLAHDPNKGAIAAKAGTIALLSAWLYWQNKDNPRYDELEDWDKDSYWHFFVPVDGKEEHFRYPKIWEVGAMASLAERTVAKLNDTEPEYGKSVGRILKNLFHLNTMPQVAAPLYEQATNRNGFTNAPIETPGMENMQPFLRAKPSTSETLKAVGMATRDLPESMQVNPVKAEALLRGYFNTWAMYGLMLTDSAFYSDKLPEKRMDELPVVRRFYEADPVKHTKYETMFYDMLGEARRLQGTLRELDDTGRSEIADEIEQAPLSSKAKQLERASRNIGTINADMEAVRQSDLTPAEKRTKLDVLIAEKNILLKAIVLDVKGQEVE